MYKPAVFKNGPWWVVRTVDENQCEAFSIHPRWDWAIEWAIRWVRAERLRY